MNDRYAIGGQEATEPGSQGRVLRNKLGITQPADMNEAELVLLEELYESILANVLPRQQLTVGDIKTWHRRWLGNIYDWAGQERAVNMVKQVMAHWIIRCGMLISWLILALFMLAWPAIIFP